MNPFHAHDFKLVCRTYAAPVAPATNIRGDMELIKTLRFGLTTFVFLCKCGQTSKIVSYGEEQRGVLDIKFHEVKR